MGRRILPALFKATLLATCTFAASQAIGQEARPVSEQSGTRNYSSADTSLSQHVRDALKRGVRISCDEKGTVAIQANNGRGIDRIILFSGRANRSTSFTDNYANDKGEHSSEMSVSYGATGTISINSNNIETNGHGTCITTEPKRNGHVRVYYGDSLIFDTETDILLP